MAQPVSQPSVLYGQPWIAEQSSPLAPRTAGRRAFYLTFLTAERDAVW